MVAHEISIHISIYIHTYIHTYICIEYHLFRLFQKGKINKNGMGVELARCRIHKRCLELLKYPCVRHMGFFFSKKSKKKQRDTRELENDEIETNFTSFPPSILWRETGKIGFYYSAGPAQPGSGLC